MKNLNKLVVALGMTSALFLVGGDKEKSSDMAKDNAMAKPMDQMEAPSDGVGESLKDATKAGFDETSQATKGATIAMEKGANATAVATKEVSEGAGQAANEATGESRVIDPAQERETRDSSQHNSQTQ